MDNLPVIVSAAILAVTALITGWFGHANHKTDAKARIQPTTPELWTRLDTLELKVETERSARIHVENKLDAMLRFVRAYIARVQTGGTVDLTPEEKATLIESTIEETT